MSDQNNSDGEGTTEDPTPPEGHPEGEELAGEAIRDRIPADAEALETGKGPDAGGVPVGEEPKPG